MLYSAACWMKSGPSMMGRVFQNDSEILQMERVPQRELDTDVGGDAGEHQVADAARAQHAVDVGVEETAVARLRDDDVARLRLSASTIA